MIERGMPTKGIAIVLSLKTHALDGRTLQSWTLPQPAKRGWLSPDGDAFVQTRTERMVSRLLRTRGVHV